MTDNPPDRAQEPDRKPKTDWGSMLATCGHEDPLGYFAMTACGSCARKGHRKATGR